MNKEFNLLVIKWLRLIASITYKIYLLQRVSSNQKRDSNLFNHIEGLNNRTENWENSNV
jgi:hypothetical protein